MIGDIHKDDWLTYLVKLTGCKVGAEGDVDIICNPPYDKGSQHPRRPMLAFVERLYPICERLMRL